MTCPRCRAAELRVRRDDIIPCVEQLHELLASGVCRAAFDEATQRWSTAPRGKRWQAGSK